MIQIITNATSIINITNDTNAANATNDTILVICTI